MDEEGWGGEGGRWRGRGGGGGAARSEKESKWSVREAGKWV